MVRYIFLPCFIHSLKRGDRLSKKRATKKRQIPSCVMGKSDSDIYYNKTSDKAATKWVTSNLGYTLDGRR
jgi:hypothetical protein